MKKTFFLNLILLCLFTIFSCKQEAGNLSSNNITENNNTLFADTIIYDVIIKNTNPLDHWTIDCLKNLDRANLVDYIFDIALTGDYDLFDYFSGEEIGPHDIRKLEKENEDIRMKIGKIQFTEIWYSDNSVINVQKEIIAMVPGMEIIGLDGKVRGYKPVFKLKMK